MENQVKEMSSRAWSQQQESRIDLIRSYNITTEGKNRPVILDEIQCGPVKGFAVQTGHPHYRGDVRTMAPGLLRWEMMVSEDVNTRVPATVCKDYISSSFSELKEDDIVATPVWATTQEGQKRLIGGNMYIGVQKVGTLITEDMIVLMADYSKQNTNVRSDTSHTRA